MGQVQNGHLYLRVWEQLCDNHSKVEQNTYKEPSLFYYCKKCSRVLLTHSKTVKNKHKNFDFVLSFFLSSFPSHITRGPQETTRELANVDNHAARPASLLNQETGFAVPPQAMSSELKPLPTVEQVM